MMTYSIERFELVPHKLQNVNKYLYRKNGCHVVGFYEQKTCADENVPVQLLL